MKETPLFLTHKKMNAKFVNFNGWNMPVWFRDLKEEHLQVRQGLGIFDVSHMGELEILGKGAEDFIDYTFTNTITNLKNGKARYGFFCNEKGGVIDDVIIYKLDLERFFICVNAGNVEKVYNWLNSISEKYDVSIKNLTAFYGQLAIQGPKAVSYVDKLFPLSNINEIKKYSISKIIDLDEKYKLILKETCPFDDNFLIARTGYTGEDGFELFVPNEVLEEVYSMILSEIKNIEPCGLGSRDTLRLEKGFPLHGNELTENLNPVEANLEKFIDFNKKDFIGKESLKLISNNPNFILIGFKMDDKGVPRSGYKIFSNNIEIGYVTSGTFSPCLEEGIGLAVIKKDFSELENIEIKIRKDMKRAKKVQYPFI